jgi:hypothetical protein
MLEAYLPQNPQITPFWGAGVNTARSISETMWSRS